MKYVVVTAARDEAGYIEHTIKSLIVPNGQAFEMDHC